MAPHSDTAEDDPQGVQQLREWVAKQPHLPPVPDKILARVLYSCYGSVERAKTTVDNFITIITHAPDVFGNLSKLDENYRKAMDVVYVIPLEERTKEGYRPVLIKFQDTDPNKFDMVVDVRSALATFAVVMDEDDRIPGYVAMLDLTGLTMGHIMKISMTCLKQLLVLVQDGIPIRLKGIHFINSVPIVQNVVNLVKPLMRRELMEIFHVHAVNEMPKFYAKFVPQSAMPLEYGGKDAKIHDIHRALLSRVEANVQSLRDIDALKVDESKRLGKKKTSSDIFGMEGSFKKLDLD